MLQIKKGLKFSSAYDIFTYTLQVCLSVRLYPINAKTAEPIGPQMGGPQKTTGKAYGCSKLQNLNPKVLDIC